MNASTLQAEAREQFGKGAAHRLRAAGKIPGLVYSGGNEPLHITLDPAELRLVFQRSGNPNTVLNIKLGDVEKLVLLKATQKHPVSRDLLHADFFEISPDKEVVVEVPIKEFGRAKGLIMGGKLQRLRRTVPVKALPANIPAVIEVDITEMDLGDFMRASDIKAPEGAELSYENDFNVFSMKGRRVAVTTEEEES